MNSLVAAAAFGHYVGMASTSRLLVEIGMVVNFTMTMRRIADLDQTFERQSPGDDRSARID
jgi:hypothetical protein